jgi:hypothetical protein
MTLVILSHDTSESSHDTSESSHDTSGSSHDTSGPFPHIGVNGPTALMDRTNRMMNPNDGRNSWMSEILQWSPIDHECFCNSIISNHHLAEDAFLSVLIEFA